MVITNYGNNHSGKTTFSVALATRLSQYNKGAKIIIINFDNNAPAHAIWEPTREMSNIYSLGTLLEEKEISSKNITRFINTHENHDNIGLLGYCLGDTPLSHKDLKYDNVLAIIKAAEEIADFVIVDCSSPLLTEQLTASIEMADCLNIIVSPDVNGATYLKTATKMFSKTPKYFVANTNYILSPVKSFNAVKNFIQGFNFPFVELPYVQEIEVQNCNGKMFEIYKHAPKTYLKVVDRIISTFNFAIN